MLLFAYLLEGMRSIIQADQVHRSEEETDRQGEGHDAQAQVGQQRDGTELKQAGQAHHQPCEHQRRFPYIPPIQQVHH